MIPKSKLIETIEAFYAEQKRVEDEIVRTENKDFALKWFESTRLVEEFENVVEKMHDFQFPVGV